MDKICCTPKPFEISGEGDCVIGCCKSDIKIQKVVITGSEEGESVPSSLLCCCFFKRIVYKSSKQKPEK